MFSFASVNRRVSLFIAVAVMALTLTGGMVHPTSAFTKSDLVPADLPYVPGEILIAWKPDSAAIRPAGLT